MFADDRIDRSTVVSLDGRTPGCSKQIGALCAIRLAAAPDHREAAFGVLLEVASTFGHDRYRHNVGHLAENRPRRGRDLDEQGRVLGWWVPR